MILLVTSSDRGGEGARAIEAATGEATIVAESLVRATTLLRESSYLALVLDQQLAETEPLEADTMMEHLDTAILVQVNLAISGKDRLVRDVRSALGHRTHEEALARRAATSKFASELNGTLTALLLTVELALETAAMPVAVGERLQSVYGLVKKLRRQLEASVAREEQEAATCRM